MTVDLRVPFLVLAAACVLASGRAALAADVCGDVNGSGSISSADALQVLKKAVGQSLFLTCGDYPDRYGFPADVHKNSPFSADYLLGMPVTIERPATVTHLGLISRDSGNHIRMALYTDNAGSPDALVAATGEAEILPGSQEIPVTSPTEVAASKYWIMAVYDVTTTISADDFAPPGNFMAYRDLAYGDPLPDPFGAALTYDETQVNYWVKVQQ